MPNETHRASLRYKISEFFRILLGNIDNPVLIHYGAYETIFLKRLARRYPDSTPDSSSISTLIARRVNLLGITYSQIYFPTYSNRLKEVPVVAPGRVGASVPCLETTMGGNAGYLHQAGIDHVQSRGL